MRANEERPRCALLRPRHAPSTERGCSPRRRHAAREGDPPLARPRTSITHIDRVIIRKFYHEDAGAHVLEAGPFVSCNAELPQDVAAMLLPLELDSKLSPLPPGYYRIITGRDVLLIEPGLHVVVDVLRDVLDGAGARGRQDCSQPRV